MVDLNVAPGSTKMFIQVHVVLTDTILNIILIDYIDQEIKRSDQKVIFAVALCRCIRKTQTALLTF